MATPRFDAQHRGEPAERTDRFDRTIASNGLLLRLGLFLLLGIAVGPASTVGGAEPAARWEFGPEEPARLTPRGGVDRDQPGPRPPRFPDFTPQNTAVKLDGQGGRLELADPGPGSPFDFTNGDALTIEAWVQAGSGGGEFQYVVGKGRTGAPGFAPDNQNWALRLRTAGDRRKVSFLFATPRDPQAAAADAHWHRWTSGEGFTDDGDWHHVAIAYEFGKPESIRGWIDGRPLPGSWDMGGPTAAAPVVDDDAVWIGSAQGGSPGNSFRGSLDAIVLHRERLTDETIESRYRREGAALSRRPAPETPPQLTDLRPDVVTVSIHEGLAAHDRWLLEGESWPAETTRWTTSHFLLPRLPLRYDAWGVRDRWRAPLLLRMAADVRLPPGPRHGVLRLRALGRLWVNDRVVARTAPLVKSPPDGEEPLDPPAVPIKPGARPVAYRQQEVEFDFEVPADGRCRIVLETVAGGPRLRTETGEIGAAIETLDGRAFELLGPTVAGRPPLLLTDADLLPRLASLEAELAALDDATRRAAAASRDGFWRRRREAAEQWAARHPAPPLPPGDARHPIDRFLEAKATAARAAARDVDAQAAEQFHSTILPALRERCFRCHGDKTQGGLKLDRRDAVLAAGDSGLPAVKPRDPAGSELLRRIRSRDPAERMPPTGVPLDDRQIAAIEAWIAAGAAWPAAPLSDGETTFAPLVDDAAFLRRLSFDTVGVPPSESELRDFLADRSPDKRERWIDRRLADERRADQELGYWLDVLAENPTLINASLNSTGPFRWYLHEAFRDGRSWERIVTELVLLRGAAHEGGAAGFGLSGESDSPPAARSVVAAGAFLGVELQCARCHDSPYHATKQSDLYALAALFDRRPTTVPKTSSVPAAFFEKQGRESLIQVTLPPGRPVTPNWPLAEATGVVDGPAIDALMDDPADSRERLAALITAPENRRFARVTVNRVWRRLMGGGIVEPPHDWEGRTPSHPELLDWLAHDFTAHGADLTRLARWILTSQAYQRTAGAGAREAPPERRFFTAPDRRRLTAEQVVDALHAATGRAMDVEELTFDPTGRRAPDSRLTLGTPRRAWMLATLANERDRPSLSLPKAQAVVDVLEAFGWNGVRQSPRTDRETAANVLQPGVLANGLLVASLAKVSRDGALAELAVAAESPAALVESLFLRFLSRMPTEAERAALAAELEVGFASRIVPPERRTTPAELPPLPRVTWFNHLRPEANTIAQELERRARLGPPVDPRLDAAWREAYEDVVWSLINRREFVWTP